MTKTDFIVECTATKTDFIMECTGTKTDFIMECTATKTDFVMECTATKTDCYYGMVLLWNVQRPKHTLIMECTATQTDFYYGMYSDQNGFNYGMYSDQNGLLLRQSECTVPYTEAKTNFIMEYICRLGSQDSFKQHVCGTTTDRNVWSLQLHTT